MLSTLCSRYCQLAVSILMLTFIIRNSRIFNWILPNRRMMQYTLNSERSLPALGYGTWKSEKGTVKEAVKNAIDAGYRHIDCALVYENEAEVGDGIADKIQDGTVTRDDLFITSKLWSTYMRPDTVSEGFQKSLTDLKLTYLDLYLIHWPVALQPGEDLNPFEMYSKDGEEGVRGAVIDTDYLETYKELEKLVEKGLVKSIGVSNFNGDQIQRLVKNCRIKPAINQIELHPYMTQRDLVTRCQTLGIHVTAYSPLGSPDRSWAPKGEKGPLLDSDIAAIGKRYNKSIAQVLIRFAIQRGLSVLAKTVTTSRMKENMQVLDFELSDADMNTLFSMDKGQRMIDCDEWSHSKYCPF